MSLLQKASIITTPTAYAEDYLYSIKPAYALGSELVTNGSFDTDSNWTKTSGAVISNGVATITVTGGGYQSVAQSISLSNTKKYRLTAVVNGTSGKAATFVDNSANNGGLTTSNGVITFNGQDQNVDITWTANSNSFEIEIIRNGSGDFSFTVDSVSVKEVTDADFDFDRNSTGTRVNEDYLIEDVPYNLLTYSEEIKSTNSWVIQSGVTVTNNDVLAPNGTLTADKLVGNGTAGVYKQVAVTGVVTRSVYLKSVTGTVSVVLKDPALTVTQKTLSVTEEWQRFQLSESNGHASQSGIWVDDIPASGIYMWGAQIVKGDQPKEYLKTTDRLDIPRIDYTNGEPSILLEPSRTNLVTYSQDFTQWNKASTSLTANQITSPDGTTTGSLVQSTGTGTSLIEPSGLSLTIGVTYTYSVFVKKGNNQWIRLAHISSSATGCWFDLDNGVLGTVNSTSATIDKYPNGWYRITNTFVATHSSTGNSAFIGICDNNGSTNAGVIGQNVYIYGAQVEVGSYPTSLIHTSGSAVTRSADVANNAGNSDLINSTEGVLYAEMASLANDGTNRKLAISDGTNQNVVVLQFTTVTNQLRAFLYNGALTVNMYNVLSNALEYNKIAFKFKANDFSLYVNGSEVVTDTSGTTFSAGTLTEFNFNDGGVSDPFYANVKSVMVFKEALTDLELEKLTGYNNHELYMNYYNRLSYLGLAEEYNVESDINNYIL